MSEHTKLILYDLALMLSILLVCIALGEVMNAIVITRRINTIMVFVLGVVVVAAYRRTKVGFIMPVVAMVTFIYLFVPKQFSGIYYAIAIIIMIVIAALISGMANRIRQQGEEATKAAMVIEKERLRNILLSSVSHDLRTPLAAISGAASSLMVPEPLDDDMRRDLSASIYRESQRLNRLLRNLLDMSRIESGTMIHREWHSIEEIVGAALSQLERELSANIIITDIPFDLPLVMLDDTLIEQVLINLLDNASKYVPEDKSINIWAKKETDQLLVGVDTNGVVMGQEELNKLFDKFYRGPNVGTTHGTGLGLTICKAIVEMHGGKIWAVQLPRALSFQFTLPTKAVIPTIIAEDTDIPHA